MKTFKYFVSFVLCASLSFVVVGLLNVKALVSRSLFLDELLLLPEAKTEDFIKILSTEPTLCILRKEKKICYRHGEEILFSPAIYRYENQSKKLYLSMPLLSYQRSELTSKRLLISSKQPLADIFLTSSQCPIEVSMRFASSGALQVSSRGAQIAWKNAYVPRRHLPNDQWLDLAQPNKSLRRARLLACGSPFLEVELSNKGRLVFHALKKQKSRRTQPSLVLIGFEADQSKEVTFSSLPKDSKASSVHLSLQDWRICENHGSLHRTVNGWKILQPRTPCERILVHAQNHKEKQKDTDHLVQGESLHIGPHRLRLVMQTRFQYAHEQGNPRYSLRGAKGLHSYHNLPSYLNNPFSNIPIVYPAVLPQFKLQKRVRQQALRLKNKEVCVRSDNNRHCFSQEALKKRRYLARLQRRLHSSSSNKKRTMKLQAIGVSFPSIEFTHPPKTSAHETGNSTKRRPSSQKRSLMLKKTGTMLLWSTPNSVLLLDEKKEKISFREGKLLLFRKHGSGASYLRRLKGRKEFENPLASLVFSGHEGSIAKDREEMYSDTLGRIAIESSSHSQQIFGDYVFVGDDGMKGISIAHKPKMQRLKVPFALHITYSYKNNHFTLKNNGEKTIRLRIYDSNEWKEFILKDSKNLNSSSYISLPNGVRMRLISPKSLFLDEQTSNLPGWPPDKQALTNLFAGTCLDGGDCMIDLSVRARYQQIAQIETERMHRTLRSEKLFISTLLMDRESGELVAYARVGKPDSPLWKQPFASDSVPGSIIKPLTSIAVSEQKDPLGLLQGHLPPWIRQNPSSLRGIRWNNQEPTISFSLRNPLRRSIKECFGTQKCNLSYALASSDNLLFCLYRLQSHARWRTGKTKKAALRPNELANQYDPLMRLLERFDAFEYQPLLPYAYPFDRVFSVEGFRISPVEGASALCHIGIGQQMLVNPVKILDAYSSLFSALDGTPNAIQKLSLRTRKPIFFLKVNHHPQQPQTRSFQVRLSHEKLVMIRRGMRQVALSNGGVPKLHRFSKKNYHQSYLSKENTLAKSGTGQRGSGGLDDANFVMQATICGRKLVTGVFARHAGVFGGKFASEVLHRVLSKMEENCEK